MASNFTREHLKICVAKICLTIGWHNTMTTPMDMLTDILYNYLFYLAKATTDYAHQFGMNEANLEHLTLTFKDFRMNLKGFNEYLNSVDCPSRIMVPRYPVPKQDHLNFLKPGSREVVSRQVHIHEHLPPMFPLLDTNTITDSPTLEQTDIQTNLLTPSHDDSKKKPRIVIGQAVRELTSVIMTTSGFLSPAREGRLPESRTPAIALEPSIPPNESFKKPSKMKKFLKMRREFLKQFSDHESLKKATKVRKRKLKSRNTMAAKNYMIVTNPEKPQSSEYHQIVLPKEECASKHTLPTPKPLFERFTIKDESFVEKLSTKPSKRKINILRKISVKNKTPKICKEEESKYNAGEDIFTAVSNNIPNLSVVKNTTNDFVIQPINPVITTGSKLKKPINILRKQATKKKTDLNLPPKVKEKSKSNMETFNFMTHDNMFKYHSSDVKIEPINIELPTKPVNKQANILKKVSSKRSKKVASSKEINRNYSSGLTASIIKDVGLNHNLCKDLIIEPVMSHPPSEKRAKLENYYTNMSCFDATITPKPIMNIPSTAVKIDTLREPKLRPPMHFTPPKLDFDMTHLKGSDTSVSITPALNIPQPTLPPMHFPFFNPFAGPGLIPPPLLNPLFPHLPIPPLGLPSFGQLPMSLPSVPAKSPTNITTPNETSIPKQEILNKAPPKETLTDNICEQKDYCLDLKLKRKKKKKDKVKHKSEKKKEKLYSKNKKKEVKFEMNNAPDILKPAACALANDLSLTSLLATKSKSEVLVPETNIHKRDASPELAKFSALITGQPKPKNVSSSAKLTEVSSSKRGRGRPRIHPVVQPQQEIWTCPVCGNEDNGNPMICCDGCNTWYHWVCVGIQIPPEASEDWYCRSCINIKNGYIENEAFTKQKGKERKW